MDCTGLTDEEFERACEACRGVRVRGVAPAYLQGLLTTSWPGWGRKTHSAAKVARLRAWQMGAFHHLILERQEARADAPADARGRNGQPW